MGVAGKGRSAALRAGLYPTLAVAGWMGVGPLLLISNRSLLTSGLKAPVSLTCIHLLGSYLFSNIMVYSGLSREQTLTSQQQVVKVRAKYIRVH